MPLTSPTMYMDSYVLYHLFLYDLGGILWVTTFCLVVIYEFVQPITVQHFYFYKASFQSAIIIYLLRLNTVCVGLMMSLLNVCVNKFNFGFTWYINYEIFTIKQNDAFICCGKLIKRTSMCYYFWRKYKLVLIIEK